jgi:hypothetical protein
MSTKEYVAGLTVTGGTSLSSNLEIKEAVLSLEEAIVREFGRGNPDEIAPVNHYHCEGNYAREIFIPKGVCIVGKLHRHEHINVISKGECLVVTEEGREVLTAPLTFISKPGIKRAVYGIEDTVWTTVHPTEATDLKEIENEVIAPSYDDLENTLGSDL